MSLGDLIEWLITTNWGRRWVTVRGVVIWILAVFFTPTFIALLMWYAHWKSHGLISEFRQVFPTPLPAPTGAS